MFFVFCLFCVFFGQKEKKEQIMQKRAEREKEKKLVYMPSKAKAKTYNKVDRSSEEAHDRRTHARAHTSYNHKN